MVGLYGMDDGRVFLILFGDVYADADMAALDLVVQRLADVMQQAGTAGLRDVHAELCGQDTGEIGHLQRVVQHVLAVRGAVAQTAQRAH